MGGTDQMDQNIGYYRIAINGKKWYWPLVTWMFELYKTVDLYTIKQRDQKYLNWNLKDK